MDKEITKLTSVKIVKKNYNDFKKTTVNSNITLQKFVNRAIDLYLRDSEFRQKIEIHETNGVRNSKY